MEENTLKQQPATADIIKIAVYGPESTGKTTLAEQLAAHYNTVWAPEFARDYLQEKWNNAEKICAPEDILPIAIGHVRQENALLEKANKYLFLDTCLMQTKVYSEMYYNSVDPLLDKAARKHKYDLFILTDIDVPWEKDDLRDKPNDRGMQFETFKNALMENSKPFITVSGDPESRLNQAITALDGLTEARSIGLTAHDYLHVKQYGIPFSKIKKQLDIFRNGIRKSELDRPAVPYDGIVKLYEEGFSHYADYFDNNKSGLRIEKFIPASGAASRMFKFLNEFLNEFDLEEDTLNSYINRKKASDLQIFLAGMEKFPFYHTLMEKLSMLFPDYNTWDRSKRIYYFVKVLLEPEYLDFCNKPKGVLPFHKYPDHIATAMEEHLQEAVYYAAGTDKKSKLHFTVSEEHRVLFENIIEEVRTKVEGQSGITIETEFSYQDKATDTIAVDPDNNPFRNDKGKLVFRPGGHGALISNLNALDSDIIFVKNIDNVIQNESEKIALYKKALAGKLLETREEVFSCLRRIEENEITEEDIFDIIVFLRDKLNIDIINDFSKYTLGNKILYITDVLNKPIRVCGMVKNEGEPGGGPFWVREQKGNLSLQIVESSQIDMNDKEQSKIFSRSTHFNPVDIVCCIRNYKGEKFNLSEFVDHSSGFIVEKAKNGKPLKGYELPGLWNGAMSKWITVFVEVPLITFNPVKTVNDLLKPAHQP
ncbi:MAG TPA: DUF4301 family protein [Flavobacterium sp.]|jgi:nicotinamide riboside kinase